MKPSEYRLHFGAFGTILYRGRDNIMDYDARYTRVPADDPRKCQRPNCRMIQVPGANYCWVHGGSIVWRSQQREANRNLRLTRWQNRVDQKSGSATIKSLAEEVGVLRMMLEEQLNACKDELDLLLHQGPVSDLVSKIERTVVACHKLDMSVSNTLDKNQVMQYTDAILRIITEHVKDEDTLIAISKAIETEMGNLERLSPISEE